MRFPLILLLLTGSIFHSYLYAQSVKNKTEREVKGKLVDSLGLFIPGATVKLISPQDTLSTSSNNEGEFHFKRVKSPNFELEFYSIGYSPSSRTYQIKENSQMISLDNVTLKEAPIELNAVSVDGGPNVRMNGDTLEYRTRHIQLREHALLEELMEKLPGMRLDLNGNLTINGKPIDKVRINGVDFFGGDVALALRNLPADLVNKLQVIDDYGEEAAMTGIKEGEAKKVLNLVVDDDRNKGIFVNSNLAGGTSDTYELGGGANVFKGDKQVSMSAGKRNTSSDNMSMF